MIETDGMWRMGKNQFRSLSQNGHIHVRMSLFVLALRPDLCPTLPPMCAWSCLLSHRDAPFTISMTYARFHPPTQLVFVLLLCLVMHGRLGDFADSPSLDAATLLGTRDCDQAGATVGRTRRDWQRLVHGSVTKPVLHGTRDCGLRYTGL